MSSRRLRIDTGEGVSFILSAVIHLAVFLLLAFYGRLFPHKKAIQETYYVDVVNLPVVTPQAGAAAQKPAAAAVETPPPVTVPPPPVMTAPKTALKSTAKPVKPAAPQESAATEAAYLERLAKLERNNEARREQAVFERLRSKVKTGGSQSAGSPVASGGEAGSRYTDYIKSRLEDALKLTSSYTTKNPEVAVRLTIGTDGRLLRMTIEHSSGDASFELAVRRAIDLASEHFAPPPNRSVFESGFVFKPKSILGGSSR